MTARLVVGSVSFGDGAPCVGARVAASLLAGGEYAYGDADGSIVGPVAAMTNGSGEWSLMLEPNASVIPAGTVWQITEYLPDGTTSTYEVEVPDSAGPHLVSDILSEVPGDLPSGPLAAHAALGSSAHGMSGVLAWVDIRDYGAVDGTDASDAVVAAVSASSGERCVWVPPGDWTISSTIEIDGCGLVMAPGARFVAAAGFAGTVVRVTARFGSGPVVLDVTAPLTSTTSTGWYLGSDTTSVAIELESARFVDMNVRRVAGFHTAVRLVGDNARGCSFNNIVLGLLENNKRGVVVDSHDSGWATHNTFQSGEIVINGVSSAGTGSRYVLIDGQSGNSFVGVTCENSAPELNLEITGGSAGSVNAFVGCRFEAGRGVSFGASTLGNRLIGCYGIMGVNAAPGGSFDASVAGGACPVVDNGRNLVDGTYGTVAFTDSGNPARFGGPAAYVARSTGYTAAGGYSDDVFFAGYTSGGTRVFAADVSGSVTLSGRMRTGQFPTAGRPSASTAGAGAMVYDTTLGKPIWSNGSVWKDAAGTTV